MGHDDRPQLLDYYHLARQEFGLDVLIEVHDERELDLVLERLPEARIIGINNRDLRTFETSLDGTLMLSPRVPADRCLVSESGIRTPEDMKRLQAAGVRTQLTWFPGGHHDLVGSQLAAADAAAEAWIRGGLGV